jgi:spermidine synthase
MSLFAKHRIHKARSPFGTIEVTEKDGVRTLHLASDTVQSSMRVGRPQDLVLSYTRSMMAFLLFRPDPRRLLLLGLGGGSLAKFAYHALPRAQVRAIEINAQIVEVARTYFELPADDARLQVEIGDGAAYVAARAACADVIMVDAYDGDSHVEALATEKFYRHCAHALERDGVLAANLWANDPRFNGILERVEAAFDGRVVCLPAERPGNVIVFAFNGALGHPRWDELRRRARELEQQYGLEFASFVGSLARLNAHDDKRLLV